MMHTPSHTPDAVAMACTPWMNQACKGNQNREICTGRHQLVQRLCFLLIRRFWVRVPGGSLENHTMDVSLMSAKSVILPPFR